MSKKSKGSKVATLLVLSTATLLNGVVVAENPLQAEASTNAKDLVVKAEKLAGALKWQVSYEYRKIAFPKSVFEKPDMVLFNKTKSALNDAEKALKGVKGKEKLVLKTRLDQNVKVYYDRAVKYIDAVTAGKKMLEKSSVLEKKIAAGLVDTSTVNAYNDLSSEIKRKSPILQRVYGKTTRAALINFYQAKAEKVKATALYPVSIKIENDHFAKAVADKNTDLAVYYSSRIEKLFLEGRQKGLLKENTKIYKSLELAYKAVKAKFDTFATVFTANSKDASKPTVVGGTSQAIKTYAHSIVIVAGKDQYIKLSNAEVNGDIIIKGDQSGAGTVYLENVKVNKINNAGGAIVVDDVADHSLHQTNVTADELRVNDTNGSNIIANKGTKIKTVIVTENAGKTGEIFLESNEAGAFGTIEIESKDAKNSEGILLRGDFTQSPVTVTGEGSIIKVAKGTKVKEMNIHTSATIEAEEGADVQEINLQASEKGQTINLKGDLKNTSVTIQNANAEIKVAEGTEIKEISKDSSVKEDVNIDNKGKIDTASGVVVKNNPPEHTADPVIFNNLKIAKAAAESKVEADYTATSWSALQAALLLPEGTDIERVAKTQAITSAISRLVKKSEVDGKLQAAKTAAASKTAADYTTASWATLQTALGMAENTEDQKVAKTQAINAAIAGLVTKSSEIAANLQAAKAAAASKVATEYTSASWSALQTALSLPEGTDAEKIVKTQAINAAVAGLVKYIPTPPVQIAPSLSASVSGKEIAMHFVNGSNAFAGVKLKITVTAPVGKTFTDTDRSKITSVSLNGLVTIPVSPTVVDGKLVFTLLEQNGLQIAPGYTLDMTARVTETLDIGNYGLKVEVSDSANRSIVETSVVYKVGSIEDQMAATAVSNKIAALPTIITLGNEAAVNEAKAAFDHLTDSQKALVSDDLKTKLTNALVRIAQIKAAGLADQQAALAVSTKIAALPTEITLENEVAVNEAKAAFEALSDVQKSLVSSEIQTKLANAIAKIAELKVIKLNGALTVSIKGNNVTTHFVTGAQDINGLTTKLIFAVPASGRAFTDADLTKIIDLNMQLFGRVVFTPSLENGRLVLSHTSISFNLPGNFDETIEQTLDAPIGTGDYDFTMEYENGKVTYNGVDSKTISLKDLSKIAGLKEFLLGGIGANGDMSTNDSLKTIIEKTLTPGDYSMTVELSDGAGHKIIETTGTYHATSNTISGSDTLTFGDHFILDNGVVTIS